MWLRLTTLRKQKKVKTRFDEEGRVDALVDVVGEQRRVEEEGDHLEGNEEGGSHEGVCDHFGEDKLREQTVSATRPRGRGEGDAMNLV